MNITKRTCSTCAAFNQAPEGDEPACWNLTVNLYKAEIGFITENHGTPQAVNREPSSTDWCDSHQTHEEDAAQTHDIEMARCLAESTPEFLNASRLCLELRDTLGEEHPETQKAAALAMSLAPHSLTEHLAAADKHNAEVARQLAESTPEFMAAMSACLHLVETLGMEHPDTTLAMQRAMMLAPPSMKAFMAEQAQELGLIPAATGYTDDGEPVYSLESIAAKLGMSMEEARETMDAIQEDRAELGLPASLVDPATVHRKH